MHAICAFNYVMNKKLVNFLNLLIYSILLKKVRNYGSYDKILHIGDNIQWHPAFCSAIELVLPENKKDLKYER